MVAEVLGVLAGRCEHLALARLTGVAIACVCADGPDLSVGQSATNDHEDGNECFWGGHTERIARTAQLANWEFTLGSGPNCPPYDFQLKFDFRYHFSGHCQRIRDGSPQVRGLIHGTKRRQRLIGIRLSGR